MKTIRLVLDADDYGTIAEVLQKWKTDKRDLPDGTSNRDGAIIAECLRDLNEYRTLWEVEHPIAAAALKKPETKREQVVGCQTVLMLVLDRIPSQKLIASWTPKQREAAEKWAAAVHFKASDNDDVRVPPTPKFLKPFMDHFVAQYR